MVTAACPPKVTGCVVPGTNWAPVSGMPTLTRPMVTARLPNVLLSRIRIWLPATLVNTMLRTVWLLNPAFPGFGKSGVGACGLAAQVVTQPGPVADPGPGWPNEAASGEAKALGVPPSAAANASVQAAAT